MTKKSDLSPLWQICETIRAATHAKKISDGSTSYEELIERKLKDRNKNSDILRPFKVKDDARPSGEHSIDLVEITKDSIIAYEIKSQTGIPHTIPGAHQRDTENMLKYCEELEERFGKKAHFVIIRRGGVKIKEHEDAGIPTHNLSDYITEIEDKEISQNQEKLGELIKKHAKKYGFSLTEESIDTCLLELREVLMQLI
jgi:hypothetical protein